MVRYWRAGAGRVGGSRNGMQGVAVDWGGRAGSGGGGRKGMQEEEVDWDGGAIGLLEGGTWKGRWQHEGYVGGGSTMGRESMT